MTWADWSAWSIDHTTVGWLAWFAFFLGWEAYTGLAHQGEMLTDHMRPIFLTVPVVWWVAFGLWLWVGIHLLAPAWEASLLDIVRTRP